MQWRRWGLLFGDIFFYLSIFPKLDVFCCWPIKGNYGRIMLRGQLWRGGKAHVNSQHAVGQQSLMESWKTWSESPLMRKLGIFINQGNYPGSVSTVLPSAKAFKNQISESGFVLHLRFTFAEQGIWQENVISVSLKGCFYKK